MTSRWSDLHVLNPWAAAFDGPLAQVTQYGGTVPGSWWKERRISRLDGNELQSINIKTAIRHIHAYRRSTKSGVGLLGEMDSAQLGEERALTRKE